MSDILNHTMKAIDLIFDKQRERDEDAMEKSDYVLRDPEQDYQDRLNDVRRKGALWMIHESTDDPELYLSMLIQLALDGVEDCDIGAAVKSMSRRWQEQQALVMLRKQAD